MTSTLALSADGRSVAVPLRYVHGPEATLVQCMCRLQTLRGDWIDDAGMGAQRTAHRDNPGTPRIQIEGEAESQLREIEGVLQVISVTAADDDEGRRELSAVVRVGGGEGPTRVYAVGARPRGESARWYTVLMGGSGPVVP